MLRCLDGNKGYLISLCPPKAIVALIKHIIFGEAKYGTGETLTGRKFLQYNLVLLLLK